MVGFLTCAPSKVPLVLEGLGPDSLVVLFTYIGGPATHVRAWMMLPPAAQVCPREINKEDSH
jgi:hypothetical protein